MTKEDLKFIEDQIGYKFHNIDLLQQAFVRRSYARENGGEDNEVLEFIGDKALDLAIVKLLAEKYGRFCSDLPNRSYKFNEYICDYNEGKLTRLKAGLVNKKMLASRTEELGIAKYLIMGRGDEQTNKENEISVKEDLFEAILGAVALDSKWNINEIQSTVDIMLCPETYLSKGEEKNYVSLIQEWSLRKCKRIPWYFYDSTSLDDSRLTQFDGYSTHPMPDTKYYCILELGNEKYRGFGISKSEARKDVCKYAYEIIESKGEQLTIQDEIAKEHINEFEAINQLEVLARRGYFSLPEYEFSYEPISSESGLKYGWVCTCKISGYENNPSVGVKSSKKDAKKEAAYVMLMKVLGKFNF